MKSGKHRSQEIQKREKLSKRIARDRIRAGKKKVKVITAVAAIPARTIEKKVGVFKKVATKLSGAFRTKLFSRQKH